MTRKYASRLLFFFSLSTLVGTQGCFFYFDTFSFGAPQSYADQAEAQTARKEYDLAIESYKKHIQNRLTNKHRPKEENPYFYYLLIGDLYLKKMDVPRAIGAYQKALDENVGKELTAERFRLLGKWYEEQARFDEAFAVLRRFRHLDPMLFDLEIDRIYKHQLSTEAVPSAPRVLMLRRR